LIGSTMQVERKHAPTSVPPEMLTIGTRRRRRARTARGTDLGSTARRSCTSPSATTGRVAARPWESGRGSASARRRASSRAPPRSSPRGGPAASRERPRYRRPPRRMRRRRRRSTAP
jgi:hypothetical protein